MYPHERALVKHLSGKPFVLLGVNSDEQLSTPQKLMKNGTVTWRSFQQKGTRGPISNAFGVRGWPTICLVDAKGVLRTMKPGRGEKLDNAIAELLAEIDVEFPHEAIKADKGKRRGR